MDFKYVPERHGYEDPAQQKIFLKNLLFVCYMDITLSALDSKPNAKSIIYEYISQGGRGFQ